MKGNISKLIQQTQYWFNIGIFFIERRIVRYLLTPFLPIKKNKIVFDNFCGRGLGDSPMYIAKEIISQGLDYDLVWLVKDMNEEMPHEIRKVKYRSFKSLIEITTAKIWVDNQILGIVENKRKSQYFVETWHGSGVLLKYIQRAAADTYSEHEKKINIRNSKQIDLIISDNKMISENYKENFWLSETCEILECGAPYRDGLYRTKEEVLKVKRDMIGERDVKIALFAPTYRNDDSIDGYRCDIEAVRNKLEEKTKKKWMIIVRMHPNAAKASNLFSFNDSVINGSYTSNPMDLMVISDLLITDYSSMSSDFLYLDKPVFILALDLDHYVEKCRKLYPYFYSLPFPFCRTNKDLLEAIDNFSYSSYLEIIKDYKDNVLKPFGDGHASKCVVERIKNIIDGTNG